MSRASVPATGELVVGRIVDVSMFPMGGDAVGMTFVDVTEVRAAEEKLQRLVDHDSLTELWNRRRFRAELAAHLANGPRKPLRADPHAPEWGGCRPHCRSVKP